MEKIIIVVVLVVAIGGVGYFFYQNQALENQIAKLKDEKADVEKDFAVFKATDFAKENEILTLKLKTTEKDLSALQSEVPDLKARVKNFETSASKMEPYLSAIDAIENMVGGGPTAAGVANVDSKVNKLQDDLVSERWANAKRGMDLTKSSWMGVSISDTVISITSRIRSFFR